MTAQEHTLKTIANYYDAVERGEKPFEVRRDDRGFQRGDILILQRLDPDRNFYVERDYQGRVKHEMRRQITYVLTGGQLGIEPGYVVLGLAAPTQSKAEGG